MRLTFLKFFAATFIISFLKRLRLMESIRKGSFKKFWLLVKYALGENFVIDQIINQTYRREIGHISQSLMHIVLATMGEVRGSIKIPISI